MDRPPNILFLISDEHRASVTGYEGDPVIRTPFLDELAATGVVFRNAYTPSPITVPTMMCIDAGRLPKTLGCEGWKQLAPGHPTFARLLSRHAYETVACGRLMHEGLDVMQGHTRRIGLNIQVRDREIEGRVLEEFQRRQRPFSEYKWGEPKEIRRAGVGRPHALMEDTYAVEGALNYISQFFLDPWYDREQPQRPILLRMGTFQPHYPYLTTEPLFKYYLNRVKPYYDETVFDHPFLSQKQVRPDVDASRRELRRAVAAYYGMIETVDGHFARVAEALREAGEDLDEWLVIYTSDHGEMMGEHGIWEKQKFFEASVRVPLIVRYPKSFAGGRVVTRNVSTCDIYATICEVCGLEAPEGLDSRSLVPLMRGETDGWIDEAVSQFLDTNFMIKQGDLKYQYYGPDMPEVLFDLARDPGETRNAIDDPEHADALGRLRRRMAELGHGPDADPDYMNAGYGRERPSAS